MTQSNTISLKELISVSIDLAITAGKSVREIARGGDLQISQKGHDDPVTIADIVAEKLIKGGLIKAFPGIRIIGEEGTSPDTNVEFPSKVRDEVSSLPVLNYPLDEITVYIDPIDATKEFTLGNLESPLTLIGIAHKSEALAGVMYQPLFGDGHLYWGIVGVGVFGVTKKPRDNLSEFVVTTTKSHASEINDDTIRKISPQKVIRVGGCGYKTLLVIDGTADAYVYATSGTKKWDTCAPEALLKAAGGCLTDLRGFAIDYSPKEDVQNPDGILAAKTAELHSRMLTLLPKH